MNPDGTQKWFLPKPWPDFPSSPVIGRDGTIYITTDGSLSTPSVFYAFNPDGSEKWKFQTSTSATEYFLSAPLIGADGTIYSATRSIAYDPTTSRVRAFNPDGTVKWEFFATGLSSGIVMAPDGTLYVGSYEKKLYAIYTSSPGLAKSGWPMIYHDAQHTSRQPDKFAPGSAAINFLLLE
jgi:outer membrane protein assembly factor BamB